MTHEDHIEEMAYLYDEAPDYPRQHLAKQLGLDRAFAAFLANPGASNWAWVINCMAAYQDSRNHEAWRREVEMKQAEEVQF